MGSDVRSTESTPVSSDFRAKDGTPLLVDRVTGNLFILDSTDTIVKIGSTVSSVLEAKTFGTSRLPAVWGV